MCLMLRCGVNGPWTVFWERIDFDRFKKSRWKTKAIPPSHSHSRTEQYYCKVCISYVRMIVLMSLHGIFSFYLIKAIQTCWGSIAGGSMLIVRRK